MPNGTTTGRPRRACLASPQCSPRHLRLCGATGAPPLSGRRQEARRPKHLLDRGEPSVAV